MGIQILPPGRVVVRAPVTMPEGEIRRLIEMKRSWIQTHLDRVQHREQEKKAAGTLSREEIQALAEQAVRELPPRLRQWAARVGVTYGRVTIRNQRTRWGSCSARGNLNFNCLLMLCPPRVADYVMVHELCHRKEMNHSKRFYDEVLRVFPDYRKYERWLKKNGASLLIRLR